ncbi:MAG: carboxymuconolactone decarboxylase family protein [Pseudomonadota bacterium]
MAEFTFHTKETGNPEQRETLEAAERKYGFIPNLIAGLVEAPTLARAYSALGDEVTKSSFSPTERHVAWFAVNRYHDCHYCMPAHTAIAKSEKIDEDVIEAARTTGQFQDQRLQALNDFVTTLVDQRGVVDAAAVDRFLAAGFTKQNVMEAILVVAHKTVSNYANHLLNTPIDAPFQKFAWEPRSAA